MFLYNVSVSILIDLIIYADFIEMQHQYLGERSSSLIASEEDHKFFTDMIIHAVL